MPTVQLTPHSSKIHFLASHGVHSVRIRTLAFESEAAEPVPFRLMVWDENHVPLWQTSQTEPAATGPLSIEKTFAVQDQLTLEIRAETEGPFSVTVTLAFNEPDADYVPDAS